MARTRPKPKRYQRKLAARKPCVHGEPGVVLRPYQIVLRPLVTEKGTHQGSRYNTFAFQVNPIADKVQIKKAVEELFNVRVEKVRTINHIAEETRFRGVKGKQAATKKALVTLHAEDKIEFF